MQPTIHLGPLTIQTFGVCFAVGFLAAAGILSRRFRELGLPVDWTWELTFSVMVGGLVGSRVDYLFENWDKVHNHLLKNVFSGSGLVWYGGAIGGALGAVIWAQRRRWLSWALTDLTCVPLALGYAIGRCGCQLSGDGDYGVHSSLPWAMAYPEGTVPTTAKVHPTPVYETLSVGLIALILWHLRDRLTGGRLFALYLVLTGIERVLVEIIRRNSSVVAGLTLPQLISIVGVAFGAAWLVRTRPTP
ncbi:MAG: prolipoprotein diacylglyceryl transferase, partial [Thermoleophilaceae bacterium]